MTAARRWRRSAADRVRPPGGITALKSTDAVRNPGSVRAVILPFVIDEQALEQRERALAASGADRLDGLVALAWHLRQRNGRRATEIAGEARALAGQLALGDASMRGTSLRLALVDAEVCWGRADYDGAQRLANEVL